MKDLFLRNARQLQYFAVQPDVIRAKYGDESEKIRHYIDLEIYGSDPFEALVPDRAAMVKRFGEPTLLRSGTLPWTIVDFSDGFEQEWSRGDCHELLRLAGFLAHYVGDASQPLHTTRHYDGYEGDRGVHARVERAVDFDIRQVSSAAQPQIHLLEIDSVWQTAIAEIRDSNSHIHGIASGRSRGAAIVGLRRRFDESRAADDCRTNRAGGVGARLNLDLRMEARRQSGGVRVGGVKVTLEYLPAGWLHLNHG